MGKDSMYDNAKQYLVHRLFSPAGILKFDSPLLYNLNVLKKDK